MWGRRRKRPTARPPRRRQVRPAKAQAGIGPPTSASRASTVAAARTGRRLKDLTVPSPGRDDFLRGGDEAVGQPGVELFLAPLGVDVVDERLQLIGAGGRLALVERVEGGLELAVQRL